MVRRLSQLTLCQHWAAPSWRTRFPLCAPDSRLQKNCTNDVALHQQTSLIRAVSHWPGSAVRSDVGAVSTRSRQMLASAAAQLFFYRLFWRTGAWKKITSFNSAIAGRFSEKWKHTDRMLSSPCAPIYHRQRLKGKYYFCRVCTCSFVWHVSTGHILIKLLELNITSTILESRFIVAGLKHI